MKSIFDVPSMPQEIQIIKSNDDTSLANQFKTPTVKINCEMQDITEVRSDR
jgi:hypothetical protein